MNYSKLSALVAGLTVSLATMAQTTSRAYIEPATITAGEQKDVQIMLDNPSDVVIGMQCDLCLPAGLSFVLDEGEADATVDETRDKKHQISSEKQSDDTYRFVLTNGNNKQFVGTSGCVLTVKVKASETLADGVYMLQLKNVALSDVNSRDVPLDNSFGYYTKGTIGDAQIATINTQLAPQTNVTTVDLSQAVVNSTATITTSNPNTMICLAAGSSIGNTKNVIIGNTCANFEMTDGSSFGTSKTFTATQAKYSRTFETNQNWGTICLPYAVKSDATVAYYKISAINAGVLSIEKYDELPANTPALVKKLSGDAIAASAEGVSVGGALGDVTGDVVMKGSYTKDTKVSDANAYYIKDNKFYSCKNYFYIDAFRAYFTVSSGAKQSVFEIGDDTVTAINALVGDSSDVKIEAVYDASGALRSEVGNGLNIVRLSNGKTQKIMVK